MKLKTIGAVCALSLTASTAMAGTLTAPTMETEPQADPFIAAAPSSGSMGGAGVGAAIGVALLLGLAIAASDGS